MAEPSDSTDKLLAVIKTVRDAQRVFGKEYTEAMTRTRAVLMMAHPEMPDDELHLCVFMGVASMTEAQALVMPRIGRDLLTGRLLTLYWALADRLREELAAASVLTSEYKPDDAAIAAADAEVQRVKAMMELLRPSPEKESTS